MTTVYVAERLLATRTFYKLLNTGCLCNMTFMHHSNSAIQTYAICRDLIVKSDSTNLVVYTEILGH